MTRNGRAPPTKTESGREVFTREDISWLSKSWRFVHGGNKRGIYTIYIYIYTRLISRRSFACYSISDDTRMFFQMSPRFPLPPLIYFPPNASCIFMLHIYIYISFLVPRLIYRGNKVAFIGYLHCGRVRSRSIPIPEFRPSPLRSIRSRFSFRPMPIDSMKFDVIVHCTILAYVKHMNAGRMNEKLFNGPDLFPNCFNKI